MTQNYKKQKYFVKFPHVYVEKMFTDLFLDSDYTNNGHCFKQAWIAGHQQMFTLPELEQIMDGAIVRDVSYDDQTEIGLVGKILHGYWINPLVELELAGEEYDTI